MSKDETRSVRQAKNKRHEDDRAYLGSEGGCPLRLKHSAKEKFLHDAGFQNKPNETKRQTDKELKCRKMFPSKRGATTAGEILEAKKSSAYHKHHRQMTATQRAQALALNPEIANSITETESKDGERNDNENEKLFRQPDEETPSRRIRSE